MSHLKYLIAACALALTVGVANANTFTVEGTFANSPALLSGTFTVDGTGQISGGDLTVGSLNFPNLLGQTVYSTGQWQVQFVQPGHVFGDQLLTLIFLTPNTADTNPNPTLDSLIGFNGGTIYGATDSVDLNGSCVYCGVTGQITPTTPLPAALPLFASGLGALGLLGWRRKRKNAAAIAA